MVERLKFFVVVRDKVFECCFYDILFKLVVIDGVGLGCERFVILVGYFGDLDKIGEVVEVIKY